MSLNVCMVTNYFYPKGYGGNAVYALCRNLVKIGLDITVLTSTIPGEPTTETLDGIQIQRIPTCFFKLFNIEYPFSPTAFKNIVRITRKADVDILHSQFLFSPLSLSAGFLKALKLSRIPLLATSHGIPHGYPSPFINMASNLLSFFSTNLVMKQAKAITAVSNTGYIFLKELFPEKVHHIPNGVDTSIFRPISKVSRTFREQIGVNENEVVVLYFAHLRVTKGILTLLEAMDVVIKKNPLVKFLVVGTGPLANKVKKFLSNYNNHAIPFIRYISEKELPIFYNACDIYVLPSYVEGMPLSLMEAMACGKPVISTDVSDIPLVARNGVNGIIIPPGDAKLLAMSILKLAESPQLRKRMGDENFMKMKKYDWFNLAEQYASLYSDILHS